MARLEFTQESVADHLVPAQALQEKGRCMVASFPGLPRLLLASLDLKARFNPVFGFKSPF